MAVLIDHQPISFAPSTRTAEAAVAGGQSILVRLARKTTATPTLWADGVSISVQIEVSSDNGVTWRPVCGMTSDGGIVPGKGGGEATESRIECAFQESVNRARVTVVITGGTFVSLLTVESL